MRSADARPDGFRRELLLAVIAGGSLVACQNAPAPRTESVYPAVGRRLLATFPAFRAELEIHSTSSLTTLLLNADGARVRSETVTVRIEPIGERLFLVTWQEANRTTVVQVQDFVRNVIYTNITRADGTFLQAKGTFVEA